MRRTLEEIAVLSRSQKRVAVLSALATADRELRELSDDLDIPRTTLSENLSSLKERGWVCEQSGTYRATTLGRTVVHALDEMEETLQTAHALEPFFEHVPNTTDDIDVSTLSDATITVADPSEPYGPTQRMQSLVSGPASFRGFSPVIYPSLGQEFHEEMRDEGLEIEIIFERDVFESVQEEFDSFTPDFSTSDVLHIGLHDGSFAYGLGIVDDQIIIGATADSGFIEVIVECDNPRALEWAESVYQTYKEDATFLTGQ
jgi:predicted transcriptional regulator